MAVSMIETVVYGMYIDVTNFIFIITTRTTLGTTVHTTHTLSMGGGAELVHR
jgi:hypothetical protein